MSQSGYIAACVRAHAMKRDLLSPDEWRRLAAMGSAPEVMEWLRQRGLTTSADAVEVVEKELRQRNIRVATALHRFLSGAEADVIKYFVYYYDLLNVESVIANLHTGGDTGGMAPFLFDTGRPGIVAADLLAAIDSFPALSNCLRNTPLFRGYSLGLEQYERDGEVAAFVASMELHFMRDWRRVVQRARGGQSGGNSAFDSFIKVRAADAMLRLRFARDAGEHVAVEWNALVPGGLLGSDWGQWYADDDQGKAARYLVERICGKIESDEEVADGVVMQRCLLEAVLREQHRNAFSIDYLISFLFRMMLQAEDLVRLIECKDFNLEQDALAEYLVGEIA